MSGFPILDLVAGLIFIYFLLSIICSSAVEVVLTAGKIRARLLAKWLKTIFHRNTPGGPALGQVIIEHGAITALSEAGESNAYLDAKNFVTVLLEQVTFDPKNPTASPSSLNEYITAITNSTVLPLELQRVLLLYAKEAKANFGSVSVKTASEIDIFRSKIESWYDSSMDRITGALKTKYSRPFTFILSTIIVVALNADSISISKYLYNNPEARIKLAAQAYDAPKDNGFQQQVIQLKNLKGLRGDDSILVRHVADSINARLVDIENAKASLESAIPLGWQKNDIEKLHEFSPAWVVSKLSGLLATILAIMMGAPFWFDVLNKISNLRGAGKKPEASKT